jgi:hypothetical protein
LIFSWLLAGLTAHPIGTAFASGPPPAHLKEHTITIDATKLVPPSWWQVPGVTPSIWASDPESLDAPKTSERRDLRLKPGKYKFIARRNAYHGVTYGAMSATGMMAREDSGHICLCNFLSFSIAKGASKRPR